MAVTVVSVVIFLCGVLVGRGVRASAGLPRDERSGGPAAISEPRFLRRRRLVRRFEFTGDCRGEADLYREAWRQRADPRAVEGQA